MVRLTRPGPELVERYRRSRERMAPTFERTDQLPSGFGQDRATVELTAPRDAFARARAALQTWAIQRDAGVEVTPPDAPVVPETTVAIVTRQLGLWFLAACRITEVIDTVREFGFTYATLPGHPERGEETFLVTRANPMAGAPARFEVAAIWRPDAMLPRLGGPLTAAVQRRATQRYLDAMVRWCATG